MAPKERLQLDLSRYEKLNSLQAGHLRHFHNLVAQPDGEWHHMGGQETQQEFLDAFRYQLAQMAYAAGLAHFHRLPAARGLFKPLLRRLIHKMLHVQVWGYWYLTSQSGAVVDPGRTELRTPWANPIIKENIMYSGHLLLMTSLYAMLLDDDEFERPDSMSFSWSPMFWGLGPETFRYDNRNIQAVILSELEKNGWVGVCCEPNVVFLVCNQFPIIAMRYNDVRDGTNVLDDVLVKYKNAIREKGLIRDSPVYSDWLFLKQGQAVPAQTGQCLHELLELGLVDGKIRLQTTPVGWEYRRIAEAEEKGPNDAKVLARARIAAAEKVKPHGSLFNPPLYGYTVQWLSELGKTTELQGLLAYADEELHPSWENGGLYYPRNDSVTDEEGNWTHMDPYTGNAAIGYARLNVKDGQKMMYEKPWTRETLAARPWIDNIGLSAGVDCLRGVWDAEARALVLTLKSWNGKDVEVTPVARNLDAGAWAVYVGGNLVRSKSVERSGSFEVDVTVGGEEVDIVFVKYV
ncbi:hypothetical protein S7711_02653 [Stachybotrys chartarum IBT 7711]|uniref:Linalool dehydratase/isomerase domain-containing protein n=1 Tax=Stachybotrys chartarum (strain CBS 109288 / IBT 7711) TaxID=1280523 RepID=A0A084B934_STACB|nr:hypothetical protein S7711_02653 [Stachybotrys chartarum IBT 7711]